MNSFLFFFAKLLHASPMNNHSSIFVSLSLSALFFPFITCHFYALITFDNTVFLLCLGSSSLPIILHLYACSQPEVFNSIAAGNVLVCARMLLKVESQDSKQARICFLTTSRESQLYALKKPSDVNNKPFSDSTEIADAIKWRQSGEAKHLLMVSCSGGYYSFPPLNHSLELYKRTFPQGSEMSLITTVNLGFVMKELHYREQLRLHIQGIVVAMEFVPTARSVGSASDETTQMSSSQLSETQRSDKHSQGASSQPSSSQSSCK